MLFQLIVFIFVLYPLNTIGCHDNIVNVCVGFVYLIYIAVQTKKAVCTHNISWPAYYILGRQDTV